MKRAAIAIALAASGSCTDDAEPPRLTCLHDTSALTWMHRVPLAEIAALPGFRPTASRDTTFPTVIGVKLATGAPYESYTQIPLRDDDGHLYCPLLESLFTASLDGHGASVVEGGWQCSHGTLDGPACTPMSFEIDLPTAPQGKIVYGDDSLTLEIDPPPPPP